MTTQLILRAIGGALGWAIIGLIIAALIKVARRDKPLPRWPIYVFAGVGFAITLVVNLAPPAN